MMRSSDAISFWLCFALVKTITLVDLRSCPISNRFQNGLASASVTLFGPLAMLLTLVTSSSASTLSVSFATFDK